MKQDLDRVFRQMLKSRKYPVSPEILAELLSCPVSTAHARLKPKATKSHRTITRTELKLLAILFDQEDNQAPRTPKDLALKWRVKTITHFPDKGLLALRKNKQVKWFQFSRQHKGWTRRTVGVPKQYIPKGGTRYHITELD